MLGVTSSQSIFKNPNVVIPKKNLTNTSKFLQIHSQSFKYHHFMFVTSTLPRLNPPGPPRDTSASEDSSEVPEACRRNSTCSAVACHAHIVTSSHRPLVQLVYNWYTMFTYMFTTIIANVYLILLNCYKKESKMIKI